MIETTGIYQCGSCNKAQPMVEGKEAICRFCGAEQLSLLLEEQTPPDNPEDYLATDAYERLRQAIAEQEDAETVTPLPDSETVRVRALQSARLGVAVWTAYHYEPVYRGGKEVGMALVRYENELGEVV